MSLADLRRPLPPAKTSVSAAPSSSRPVLLLSAPTLAAVIAVAALCFLFAPSPPAAATSAALVVTMDRALTPVSDSAALTVSGDAVAGLSADATVEVRVTGPAALSQITRSNAVLPEVGTFSIAAGSLPAAARPGASQLHLPLPMTALPLSPGAYRVTVEIRSGGSVGAIGRTWMGRIVPRTSAAPLDIAFVWRAEFGIHRDVQGRFIDTALDEACAAGGALRGLSGLTTRFPEWRFSLGIEPVLLTQLRDMAGGFTRADGSQEGAVVGADDQAAKDAEAVLMDLGKLAEDDTVEVAPGPYAGADLGLLATESWRDGFEQLQLGKLEVVQALALGFPPAGAYSPGLDLTSSSLRDYGHASIDHVLVDAGVGASLKDPPAIGAVAARAENDTNDRVTLVLADSDLRALVAPPWDAPALFAGIAAVLASGDREALALTTGPDYAVPPQPYLDSIGEELRKDTWIRTQTMSDLLKSHPAGTRPVLLTRDRAEQADSIGQAIFSAIRNAHIAVDDLAAAADPASVSLEAARHYLYLAESRWWSRKGVSPEEARTGVGYAVQAQTTSEDQLKKIDLTGMTHAFIFGRRGTVTVSADNRADSAMTVQLRLSGDGLTFPQGNVMTVKLKRGGNNIVVPVTGVSRTRELTARLVVGETTLAERKASLRSFTLVDIVPWAGLAAGVIILIVMVLLLVRGSRRRLRR